MEDEKKASRKSRRYFSFACAGIILILAASLAILAICLGNNLRGIPLRESELAGHWEGSFSLRQIVACPEKMKEESKGRLNRQLRFFMEIRRGEGEGYEGRISVENEDDYSRWFPCEYSAGKLRIRGEDPIDRVQMDLVGEPLKRGDEISLKGKVRLRGESPEGALELKADLECARKDDAAGGQNDED